MKYMDLVSNQIVTAIRFTGKNHKRLELFAGSSRKFHELREGDWIVKRGHADYWAVTKKRFEEDFERVI